MFFTFANFPHISLPIEWYNVTPAAYSTHLTYTQEAILRLAHICKLLEATAPQRVQRNSCGPYGGGNDETGGGASNACMVYVHKFIHSVIYTRILVVVSVDSRIEL